MFQSAWAQKSSLVYLLFVDGHTFPIAMVSSAAVLIDHHIDIQHIDHHFHLRVRPKKRKLWSCFFLPLDDCTVFLSVAIMVLDYRESISVRPKISVRT